MNQLIEELNIFHERQNTLESSQTQINSEMSKAQGQLNEVKSKNSKLIESFEQKKAKSFE